MSERNPDTKVTFAIGVVSGLLAGIIGIAAIKSALPEEVYVCEDSNLDAVTIPGSSNYTRETDPTVIRAVSSDKSLNENIRDSLQDLSLQETVCIDPETFAVMLTSEASAVSDLLIRD